MKNDNGDVEQDGFRINTILDQYLDGEELKELILEEGNVFNNDLPWRTSRIDAYDDFQFFLKKSFHFFEIF